MRSDLNVTLAGRERWHAVARVRTADDIRLQLCVYAAGSNTAKRYRLQHWPNERCAHGTEYVWSCSSLTNLNTGTHRHLLERTVRVHKRSVHDTICPGGLLRRVSHLQQH